jgi:hypothetical protein
MTERRAEIIIGWADGRRVTAEVALRPVPDGFQTTTHQPAVGLLGLSVTSYLWRRDGSDIETGGATRAHLRGRLDRLAPDITREDVTALADIGDRWHLNDLSAGCVHQEVVWEDGRYGRQPSLTATEPCPETGYRYGSAWLVEPLPEDVIATAERWIALGRAQ